MLGTSLYLAAAFTGLRGVTHFFAAKGVVTRFGDISVDNRRIITMDGIVEGVALISITSFVLCATLVDPNAEVSRFVYAAAIVALLYWHLSQCLLAFASVRSYLVGRPRSSYRVPEVECGDA